MDKIFLDSKIGKHDQLKFIVGVLGLRILLAFYNMLGNIDSINEHHIINILNQLCDLIGMYYLYLFVRFDLKQKISLFLTVISLIVSCYVLLSNAYMLIVGYLTGREMCSICEECRYDYIPSLLAYVALIGLAVQLLSNTHSGKLGKAVKLVGIIFIVETVGVLVLIFIKNVFLDIYLLLSFLTPLLFSLASMAMIYLYTCALNEPIVEEKL